MENSQRSWPADLLAQDFRDRRILVTGSSRGIGAALASAFADLGARVALHGASLGEDLRRTGDRVARSGRKPLTLIGDFRQSREIERVIDAAVSGLGGLDILVNNAGTMMGRHAAESIADETLEAILALNARALSVACRRAIPALKAGRDPVILNTVSISARTGGSPGSSAYSAAKAYAATLTRALAVELAPQRIRVNAVSPGTIMTDFHRRYSTPEKLAATAERIPMKRLGEAEDCIGAYLFLASPSLAGYITGQIVEVNGGALMP